MPSLVDLSVKTLFRAFPQSGFLLAGQPVDPSRIRLTESSVIVNEFWADQVFIVEGEPGKRPWGSHQEYQLAPDPRVRDGWILKNAALNVNLKMPVILTVIYLEKGNYATFPDTHIVQAGGRRNVHQFERILLWEHADRIRTGEWWWLSPLLVLCEDHPTSEVMEEERRLILDAEASDEVRNTMIGLAITIGRRSVAEDVLNEVFREEIDVLKELSFVQDWVLESKNEGRTETARATAFRLLSKKFGDLPPSIVAQIESASASRCDFLIDQTFEGRTLAEMGLV